MKASSYSSHMILTAALCGAVSLSGWSRSHAADKAGGSPLLEEVASFPKQQVTGVAVSKTGRVFVNFPFWSDDHTVSVAEVLKDGTVKPYPSEEWNRKEGPAEKRFVCVQSVYVDDTDTLWILDPAAPKLESVVKGGPKLLKVNLKTDKVVQTIPFEEAFAPERSYLNDVRVDTKSGHAFITESGLGSLVIVNLESGKKRRVLANHPSTKAEAGFDLVVDGIRVTDPKTKTAPAINADGIALDVKNGELYYHALTGRTLYKIKTEFLKDESLSDEDLAAKVVKVAETPAPDGMLADKEGRIYLTAFENNGIVRFDPQSKRVEAVIEDKRLQWPDSLSWGPDGSLYITTSQIHRMPKFNEGQSKQLGPFAVYRLKMP